MTAGAPGFRTRLRMLAAAGVLLLTACGTPATQAGPAAPPAAAGGGEGAAPVVRTASGQVRGTAQDGLRRFRGIPFAAPPVGDRRWRPPQPATAWTGTRDATRSGPVCEQPASPELPRGTPRSEDCLTLDITAPAGPATNRPVLVWVPGGGFLTGAGSIHDPARLVRAGELVVVTVNYRVGVFGFLAHPDLGRSSNFGLQDQLAALRWVRANIARFGGDPGAVTLAGESAGAMSTCSLMTSPAARGLFRRAIVQSGSCLTGHPAGALGPGVGAVSSWQPIGTVQGTGRALAERLSCTGVACLRKVPADQLLPYTAQFPMVAYGTGLLPAEPAAVFAAGKEAAVPLLQGNTRDEHVEFALAAYPGGRTAAEYSAALRTAFGAAAPRVERRYPAGDFPSPIAALGRVFSDRDWICPTGESGRLHARTSPTYTYVFADPTAPTTSGRPLPGTVRPATAHGSELGYLFDFPDGPALTTEQRALAGQLVGYWARFARTGDPNGPGAPAWPRFGAHATALTFGADSVRTVDLNAAHHCGLWF
ncbi:carboxylesterase/lipase family protein [Streptomyces kasugaensis]|nr:carboxylesterase family protein [Streptomyces kasugaensis]